MTFVRVHGTIFQLEHVCNADYRKIDAENANIIGIRSERKHGSILYLWLTNGHEIRLTNEDADYVWDKMNGFLEFFATIP